ncbi:MAG: tetratricopeptide repeat protein, partial [Candidatus Sericytochromatia bacterium]|nr:tetratricopeptide repeat protein [Candidatus Sericytochromatia bacterium]
MENNDNFYINKAREAQSQNKVEEAILLYLKSLEFEPDNAVTWYRLGLLHHEKNSFTKAIECYTRVLSYAPEFVDAIVSSANAYYSLGELSKAIDLYNSSLVITPDSNVFYVLGTMYFEKKDIENTMRSYNEALKLNPNNLPAIQNLGGMYLSLGELEKAIEVLQPIADQRDDFPLINFNLAVVYHNSQKFDKAIEHYKKAIKADSTLTQGLYNLGICYIEINDYNQAMMTFRKLIKADPEFADAHYYLGNVYLHENLEEKA